jgi:nitrite reductase/ring-hydroxylating ferredoxin subunit
MWTYSIYARAHIMTFRMNGEELIEVARTQEIPMGKMKHVDVDGEEIAIVNINGNYYAFDDRCGHMCTSLSLGVLDGKIVTCPFHGAQFDCTTGRKIKEPNLAPPPVEGLSDAWKNNMQMIYNLVSDIKTHDRKTYSVTVDGDRIRIRLHDREVSSLLPREL